MHSPVQKINPSKHQPIPTASPHIVPADAPPTRLSDYAQGLFAELSSRKGVRKAIERGELRVNGAPSRTGYWVQPGDVLTWQPGLRPLPKVFPLDLPVVHQDHHLAVIDKPAGLPVSGNRYRTVRHALPHNLPVSPAPGALPHPLPVHRLDAQTSGLLLVARTQPALVALGELFAQRQVHKTYHALVHGRLPAEGRFEAPLDELTCLTTYRRLKEVETQPGEWLTWVELHPHTGRTHQLRRHLAGVGCPILGDQLYAPGRTVQHKGLFLAAVRLRLTHPITQQEVSVGLPTPHKLLRRLQRAR